MITQSVQTCCNLKLSYSVTYHMSVKIININYNNNEIPKNYSNLSVKSKL